jgi:hypothetical protein
VLHLGSVLAEGNVEQIIRLAISARFSLYHGDFKAALGAIKARAYVSAAAGRTRPRLAP